MNEFKKNDIKLSIYKPEIKDLWFREMVLNDEETMSYNKAWGGTISFPSDKWGKWYNSWVANNDNQKFYRYLQNENNEFVGEIAYHYDDNYKGYVANILIYAKYRGKGYGSLGLKILCENAKKYGISKLYDDIAADNPGISIFLKYGFVELYRTNEIILLKKEL